MRIVRVGSLIQQQAARLVCAPTRMVVPSSVYSSIWRQAWRGSAPTAVIPASTSLLQLRGYASKKGKKGKRGGAVEADEDQDAVEEEPTGRRGKGDKQRGAAAAESDVEFEIEPFEEKMRSSIRRLQKDMGQLRTGRANPAMLDSVQVQIEGQRAPLQQVAQVSVRDPLLLVVATYDPSMVAAVDKAIRSAGLNLNPSIDGKLIRVPIPKMTKELRDEASRQAARIGEQTRIGVRNVRQDALRHLKKLELAKDDARRIEKQVQTLTDKFIKETDEAVKSKVADIAQA